MSRISKTLAVALPLLAGNSGSSRLPVTCICDTLAPIFPGFNALFSTGNSIRIRLNSMVFRVKPAKDWRDNGIVEYVQYLNDGKNTITPVIHFQKEDATTGQIVEVAGVALRRRQQHDGRCLVGAIEQHLDSRAAVTFEHAGRHLRVLNPRSRRTSSRCRGRRPRRATSLRG